MTERNPNNVDGNIPDSTNRSGLYQNQPPTKRFPTFKKFQKTKTHLQQLWILEKKPMKPGAFGALQGNRCKTLQTSGFDVNDVLKDHLPFFFRSFHAMYV